MSQRSPKTSAASSKDSRSKKSSLRYQPYDGRKRPDASSMRHSSSTAASSSTFTSVDTSSAALRDILLEHILERFPNFKPRNDFDILALGDDRYNGKEKDIYVWVDEKLSKQAAAMGDREMVIAGARKILNGRGGITGCKPRSDTRGVFVRPIPNSQYSIRLFPGSRVLQHYCMDFVRTRTGESVNSPFEFELWAIPDVPGRSPGRGRVFSLENAWGLAQQEILPGQEKFVLEDGKSYILRRPGQKNVLFTVPQRRRSLCASDSTGDDVLRFPQDAY